MNCKNCADIADEILSHGVLFRFCNLARSTARNPRLVHTQVSSRDPNLSINVSRCGVKFTELLLSTFAQKSTWYARDKEALFIQGAQPSLTTPKVVLSGNDNNRSYPTSLFNQAAADFWRTFRGECASPFIKSTPGLMQHLFIASALHFDAPWCSCHKQELLENKQMCFLHFFLFGTPYVGFQLNFFLLKSLLEKTVTQGRAPLQTAGFRRLQTTGRDNKCFFAALSQTLFGNDGRLF